MDLSYFNARVKGFRGRLLRPEDYSTLLTAESMEVYADRLRATPYAVDIDASWTGGLSYGLVSTALRRNLARTFKLLWKTAPEEARPYIAPFLARWDAHNIKAIIRGIAMGISREELEDMVIPAGTIGRAGLATLVHAKSVGDVVAFLETWSSPYGRALRRGYRTYEVKHNLIEMEVNLDISVYSTAFEALGGGDINAGVVTDDLRFRIDGANVTTLLKTVGEGFSAQGLMSLYIAGGTISPEYFGRLSGLGKRVEIIHDLIENLGGGIRKVVEEADPDDLAAIEEKVVEVAEARLARVAITEPFSIAPAGSYIYMKVREIKNLRAIARGIAFSMPADVLGDLMRYPRLS
ncbi:MAG: V-type ATPase subunit [Thermodesulfobacteriota bacterium]